jgi:hypothetical protein
MPAAVCLLSVAAANSLMMNVLMANAVHQHLQIVSSWKAVVATKSITVAVAQSPARAPLEFLALMALARVQSHVHAAASAQIAVIPTDAVVFALDRAWLTRTA